MLGRRKDSTTGIWKHSNGPGLFYLIAAGMLFVTIVVWRSGYSWRVAVLGAFVLFVAFLLFTSQQNRVIFDMDRRRIHFSQRRIWKKMERIIPFDDVETVAVAASSRGTTSQTYKVVLVLKSGEPVQITAHPSSGKKPKQKTAQKISDTLNQFRNQPISPALEGVVRVSRKGESQGVPWRMDLLSANDMTPSSHWKCQAASFKNGFMLLFPSGSIGNLGAGKVSKTTKFFYRQYLKTLMIDAGTIPGFEDMEVLPKNEHLLGKLFICISNDPDAANSWLTKSLADKMIQWMEASPLEVKKGEKEPHVLVTSEGMQIIFRKLYFQDHEIQQITDFGISLIDDHLK